MENPLPPAYFDRIDETDDSLFYAEPRIVTHIDDDAIAAIQGFFDEVLARNAAILDLMSSAFSHLPDGFPADRIVGLGLNAVELHANHAFDEYVVYDLNANPTLPFADGEFAAVVLTVSVQYLTQPIEVFREVHRILLPGGRFIVIFSNRMFPTKAVHIWRATSDAQHAELVQLYFRQAGNYEGITVLDRTPQWDGYTDPVYVVMATKPE
ncbi:MAG: methyltransferase domain-containing protein [Candidatus Poribacteria bacterium]|nr:methyltransferase domain-containing protein [Candidatus Poribacteria bacterium]